MLPIKRRQFLQFAGSSLAAIGLSQFDIMQQGDQYSRVLAQGTPRKLALLVGINQYPAIPGVPSLYGCLNDIEMQYELLVNRYGFNPADIIKISDVETLKPTRKNILDAFKSHLIDQAKPGDVVVFHYSGHGSLVVDADPIPGFGGLNGTMVPYDARTEANSSSGQVQDIMGKTLFLLVSALQTENVTVVLDSCHSGGGTRGNLVFRAISSRLGDSQTNARPSQDELNYQAQWMKDPHVNLTVARLNELRQKGIAKGVALGSAQINQLAADAVFGKGQGEFHAGAFTYSLTRYLWQQSATQSLGTVFVNLARITEDVAKSSNMTQIPIQQVAPDQEAYNQQPVYFLNPARASAEAVVREVTGNQVKFWLGGISSRSLEAFQKGAIFNLVDAEGKVLGEVEQTQRSGLEGLGTIRRGQAIQGTLMREQIRGVPSDLKLQVGLDASLGNDLEAVRQALGRVDRVEVVPVNQQRSSDCLLGRMKPEFVNYAQAARIKPHPEGSLGVFTAGLAPIADAYASVEDSAEDAIARLRPVFKKLLAGKLLSLMLNSDSSDLKITTQLQSITEQPDGREVQTDATTSQQVAAGAKLRVKVTNNENRNLYIGVLVIDSAGNFIGLYPVSPDSAEAAAIVAPGQSIEVPERGFDFTIAGPPGLFEMMVIASAAPIRDALKALQQITELQVAANQGQRGGTIDLGEDAVDVMAALLGDVDRNTRAGGYLSGEVKGIDTNQFSAISTMVEVVCNDTESPGCQSS